MISLDQTTSHSFMHLVRSYSLNKRTRKLVAFENYAPDLTKGGKGTLLRWKDLDYHATKLAELLVQSVGVCDRGFVGLMVHPENICAAAVAILACLQVNVILVPIRKEKNIPTEEPFEYELYNIAKIIKLRMILVDSWYFEKIIHSKLINEKCDKIPQLQEVFKRLDMLEIFNGYKSFKFNTKLLQEPFCQRRNGNDEICLAFVNTVGQMTIGAIDERLFFRQAKFLSTVFELQPNQSILSTLDSCSMQGILMNILLPIVANLKCTIVKNSSSSNFIQLFNMIKPSNLMIEEGEVCLIGRLWIDHYKKFQWKGLEGLIFQKDNYCWISQEQLISNLEGYFGHPLKMRFFYGNGNDTDDIRGTLIGAGDGVMKGKILKGTELFNLHHQLIHSNGSAESQLLLLNGTGLVDDEFYSYQTFPEGQDRFMVHQYSTPTEISTSEITGFYHANWEPNYGERFEEKTELAAFLQNQSTNEFIDSKFYMLKHTAVVGENEEQEETLFVLSATEKIMTVSTNDGTTMKIPQQIIVNTILQNYKMIQQCFLLPFEGRKIKFFAIICQVESVVKKSVCIDISKTIERVFGIQPILCMAMRRRNIPLLKNGLLDAKQFSKFFFNGQLPIEVFSICINHKLIIQEISLLSVAAKKNQFAPVVDRLGEEQLLNSFVIKDGAQSKSHISIISLLPETLQAEPDAIFVQWVTILGSSLLDRMLPHGKKSFRVKPVVTLTNAQLQRQINKTIHLLEKFEITNPKCSQVLIIGERNCLFYSTLYACMCLGLNVGVMPVYCWNYSQFASILHQIYRQYKFTRIIAADRLTKKFLSSDQLQVQIGKLSGELSRCIAGVLLISNEILQNILTIKCRNYLSINKNNQQNGEACARAEGSAEAKFYQVNLNSTMSVATVISCTQAELYDYCGVLVKNYPELRGQKYIVASPPVTLSTGYQGTLMIMDIFMGIFQGLPILHTSDFHKEENNQRKHEESSIDLYRCKLLLNHMRLVDRYQIKVLFLPTEFMRQTISFIRPDYRGFCLKNLARFVLLNDTRPMPSLNDRVTRTFLCNNLKPGCVQQCFECPFYPGGMVTVVSQMPLSNLLLNGDQLAHRMLSLAEKSTDGNPEGSAISDNELICMGKLVEGLSAEVVSTKRDEPTSGNGKQTVGRIVIHSSNATHKSESIGFMVTRSQWNNPYLYLLGTMHDCVRYGGREWCAEEVEDYLEQSFPCLIPSRVYFVSVEGSGTNGDKREFLVIGVEVLSREEAYALAPALLFRFWERYNESIDRLVIIKYNSLVGLGKERSVGTSCARTTMPSTWTKPLREEFKAGYEAGNLSNILLDVETKK